MPRRVLEYSVSSANGSAIRFGDLDVVDLGHRTPPWLGRPFRRLSSWSHFKEDRSRQVRGIQAPIAASGDGEDALLERAREATGRRLPPIAMYEGVLVRHPDRGQQPPNLPQTQAEAAGCLAAGDAVFEH